MDKKQQVKGKYSKHDWRSCWAVEQVPGKVSGAWVFRGTRVPVSALFENLRDSASIEDFLRWFPGVRREQVEAVLEHERKSLSAALASARSSNSSDR